FGADLITAFIEAGLLVSAYAAASAPANSSKLDVARRAARPATLALLLLAGSSGLATATSAPATGSLLVGVPQINADASYYKSRLLAPQLVEAFDRQFSRLNDSLQRAQLVVTTEGFDGRFGLMLPAVRDAWAERAQRQSQAWLLTSYIVKSDGKKSNAAGAFSADGLFVGVHEKVDLAPFGEPDLAAGKEYRPLVLAPGIALGVLICQESYLQRGSLRLARAGATLLATTTSDVTFGSSTTVIEHLAMAQLRAIEAGRAMIWASNAGPSGVIDRRGRFEAGPFRTPFPVLADAQLYSDLTPFHRFATFWLWLGPAILVIASITARRGAAPSLVPISFGPAHRLWRALLGALCLVLAIATTLGASAAVEARWGKLARAWSAIPDLLASPTTLREPNAYEKFWRPAERSAEGAIAYLLKYYGLDRDDSQLLQSLPNAPSLDVIANFLKSHYGLASRRVRLDGELPMTPMLLRSAQGHYAVVDYAGSGHGGLIDFASGQSRIVAATELAKLEGVEALFPYEQR
ncbi:MAG TPA: nitrilase-related carbon-nitrogen hydrolase, partial [Polyangiaceae bacterium]|nr:nitrilase-related carbon-nitrogen hydrolase [Polyangiaceae bacterium]